jgi:Xaa-Pro aminopeptidase
MFATVDIVKDKIGQATRLLDELNLDCWIIFVRETDMMADPTLPMVVGHSATWQSFFVYTRSGEAIALVGNFDAEEYSRSGRFTRVMPYVQGVGEDFCKLIEELKPKSIAVNYSQDDCAADGLTHGMYLQLVDYLSGTSYADRLESSGQLVSKLRSRKLPSELEILKRAAVLADDIWLRVAERIQLGKSEKEVAGMLDAEIEKEGYTTSFATIANAGAKTPASHATPTDAKLSRGDLLHVDFGIRVDGYCSDIQRLLYFKHANESSAPETLREAFHLVRDIITETGKIARPGVKGYEVDARAREMLVENGFPEYQHALGHQLGRAVHDGGAIIGPRWERYGKTPEIPLEENVATTLELEIDLPGIGCVGLEEDAQITNDGAKFLGPRQMELIIK